MPVVDLYRVQCDASCGRWLASGIAVLDMPEAWGSRRKAEQAARDAGWWMEGEPLLINPAGKITHVVRVDILCPDCHTAREVLR